jgi:hypothetical protein
MGTEFKIIELTYPLPSKDEAGNDVQISAVKLERVKLKHVKLIPKSFFNETNKKKAKEGEKVVLNPVDFIPLIAGLSHLSIEKVEEIDFADIEVVLDGVIEMMGEI